jgi:hypothetical protein
LDQRTSSGPDDVRKSKIGEEDAAVRVTGARTACHYGNAMTTTQLIIDERAGTS